MSSVLFSSKYKYSDLKHAREIRVVHLLPERSSWEQPTIQIHTIHLDNKPTPHYEALSYAWGGSETRTGIKVGENEQIFVTQNCSTALNWLRSSTPRILWIDAICINQDSTAERNHQVSMMAEIYRLAAQVVVFPGVCDERTASVIDRIDNLEHKRYHNLLQQDRYSKAVNRLLRKGYVWYVMDSLYHQPWFGRTWTLQEVLLSRQAKVLCGLSKERSWESICKAAKLVRQLQTQHQGLMSIPFAPVIALQDDLDSHGRLGLFELVMRTRNLQTTEPRDKIYALFGIVHSTTDKMPAVDYSKPVAELYTDLIRFSLGELKTLDFLSYAIGLKPTEVGDLPSWAIDWSNAPRDENVIGHWRDRWFDADAKMSPLPHNLSCSGGILKVQICLLDQVSSVSSNCGNLFQTWNWKRISPDPHSPSRTDPQPSRRFFHGSNSINANRANIQTLAAASKICDFIDNENFESSIRMALNTYPLVARDLYIYLNTLCCSPAKSESNISKQMKRFIHNPDLLRLLGLLNPHNTHRNNKSWRCPEFSELWTLLEMLLMVSLPKRLGGTKGTVDRTFFTMSNGSFGLGPKEAREGDSVCIILGAQVPFVLRKSEQGTYRIVGECYVYGIMDGEAVHGLGEEEFLTVSLE
ncbi:uncharacterized protein K452DRAFT_306631 [Aplosporella prunicola CBS 121167]|uniref:Heterokaryon incompatibility domain-containing protein n=1 Tax=Aplosporella prunicola CBS 121167 TaxID=1176127 RepID=A0A6A6BIZ3_9PEZI|nr:uncharacterized protein K452DRAFT_306631 [Aplosporella prunicola CBS 121167]KAF2143986.1 hypothetical protein K452DRAFT_306631 [Aplosporella prunicola CBS 121167]